MGCILKLSSLSLNFFSLCLPGAASPDAQAPFPHPTPDAVPLVKDLQAVIEELKKEAQKEIQQHRTVVLEVLDDFKKQLFDQLAASKVHQPPDLQLKDSAGDQGESTEVCVASPDHEA
jgi:hypothetical protein